MCDSFQLQCHSSGNFTKIAGRMLIQIQVLRHKEKNILMVTLDYEKT